MDTTFELFGAPHLLALLAIALGCAAVALWARVLSADEARRAATGAALFLVVYRVAQTGLYRVTLDLPWRQVLPLHLCGVLFFLTAWMLWRRSFGAFEVAYFWTFAGASQALLTPDVQNPLPHPGTLLFFLSHGLLVAAIPFAVVAFRWRPTWASVGRAFLALNLYMLAVAPVNLLLGTNYLYLRSKPEGASLLDRLGPWPWYLVAAEGLALALFVLLYLPWAVADRWAGRRSRVAG